MLVATAGTHFGARCCMNSNLHGYDFDTLKTSIVRVRSLMLRA
jgi:hypothetical protein